MKHRPRNDLADFRFQFLSLQQLTQSTIGLVVVVPEYGWDNALKDSLHKYLRVTWWSPGEQIAGSAHVYVNRDGRVFLLQRNKKDELQKGRNVICEKEVGAKQTSKRAQQTSKQELRTYIRPGKTCFHDNCSDLLANTT